MNKYFCLFLVLSLLNSISPKTKSEWLKRSIYQLLTDRFARTSDTGNCELKKYCGGNFKGIKDHLSYIKGMGFDAIWISPIVENTSGAYHGYHAKNIYKINSHFGTADELKSLITECHKQDIWVMVDVVANHVGPVGTDYSSINPFNKAEHYHDKCSIKDWNNQYQVENCRLSGLPDLKQENSWVADKLISWIKDLIKTYDIDGIRIDTVPEVPKWFWKKFTEAAGVFQIGEVFNGNAGYVSDYQNYMDSVFNYPLYYTIKDSFCGSFKKLEEYWTITRNKFIKQKYLGVFVENHDNARFLHSCNDHNKFRNAIAFQFLWEGIPIFYYGGEQYFSGGSDPNNREPMWGHYDTSSTVYQMVKKLIKLRKDHSIWEKSITQRYADDNFYAFSRGSILACFVNNSGVSRTITYHPFKNGDKLCNILSSDDCVYVSDGKIKINMGKSPRIYVKS